MNAVLLNVIGLVVIVIAIIFHIVCIALPSYADLSLSEIPGSSEEIPGGLDIHFGVWKSCGDGLMEGQRQEKCFKMGNSLHESDTDREVKSPDWLKAVQAFGIIGVLIAGVAPVLSAVQLVSKSRGDRRRVFPAIICGICVTGGLVLLLANIIYAAKFKNIVADIQPGAPKELSDHVRLDWGFSLDCAACVLMMIAGGLHLVAPCFDSSSSSRLV